MNELKVFENPAFGQVRTIEEDGKVLFCLTDVAKALGYGNTRDAINRHCKGVVKRDTPTPSGVQSMNFGPEGDVYRLITHSKLPAAEDFEKWVFDEVVPSIRKTGGYIAGENRLTDEELLAKALLMANAKLEERAKRITQLETTVEQQKPAVLFAASVSAAETSILIGELAKLLKQNGVQTGQNRLFETLRKDGFLISRKGTDYNMPTQKAMELGLFTVKETTISHADGHTTVRKTPKVTGKGQVYFINRYVGAKAH